MWHVHVYVRGTYGGMYMAHALIHMHARCVCLYMDMPLCPHMHTHICAYTPLNAHYGPRMSMPALALPPSHLVPLPGPYT